MPPTHQDLNNQIFELKTKLSVLENQVEDLESEDTSKKEEISRLKDRLEAIKLDLVSKKDIASSERAINNLKEKISAIELELPELRLVKKLVLGMIAFILTAFLGVIWNVAINSTKKTDMVMDDISRRIAEEYRKNEQQKRNQ